MRREIIVPRYFGSEIEYGYTLKKEGERISKHLAPKGTRHVGQFLENGARLYGDGGLIEYATPECPTLEDLVAHELAGEGMVWDAYGNGLTSALTIHKRSLGPTATNSTGTHENYSTAADIWQGDEESSKQIFALASHFATRTVITGAGRPTRRGIALGQKMKEIENLASGYTTRDKPLVNTRNEPHSGGSKLSRLHIISGDANMSPYAIRMKFGTTSLVLRLLEHGVYLDDLFIDDPVKAAHQIAGSPRNINKPLLMQNKKRKSALDIQEAFATRAARLAQRVQLPPEELEVIEEWFSIINTLRNYAKTSEYQRGMEQLDWYVKQELLRRQANEEKFKKMQYSSAIAQRRALDLRYDKIPGGSGVKLRAPGKAFSPHTPSDEKVKQARTTPPEGRARLRGAMVVEIAERQKKHHDTYAVDWAIVTKNGKQQKLGPIEGRYTEEYIKKRVADLH